MRWRDEFIGLMGVTFAFGALLSWMQGVAWFGVTLFALVAVVAFAVMFGRNAHTPKVLVVGDQDQEIVGAFEATLDECGFGVQVCPGPEGRVGGCPVLAGEPCPIPGRPLAAVIFRSARGASDFPPCDSEFGIPSFDLNERSRHPTLGASDGDVSDIEHAIARLSEIRDAEPVSR